MRRWNGFLLTIVLVFCSNKSSTISAEIRQLPFCQETISQTETAARSLILVSTLDGKVSALDAAQEGKKLWSLDLTPEPLLSSNIHRRDLNSNGQWVKLIPSLKGSLYKFDGELLEKVPVTVDQLLRSSYRYSDDLVFSGGQQTKTYGVTTSDGKILYSCQLSKCTNITEDRLVEEDILIIKLHQHLVRASEPRSGSERWNFSVGYHEMTLIPSEKTDCQNKIKYISNDNIEIRAIVPDGIVIAYDKSDPSLKLWEYKFDSPIVSMWKEDRSTDNIDNKNFLKEINLFNAVSNPEHSDNPGLYIGMHERQLYVQENPTFTKAVDYAVSNTHLAKFPWRPQPAAKVTPESNDVLREIDYDINDISTAAALSVLYNSEYINGNGFYLHSTNQLEFDENNQCNSSGHNHTTEESVLVSESENDDETPVQVIIVSLWYWWKEVVIISFTTAIIMNFVLTQRFLSTGSRDAVLPPLIVERHVLDPKQEIKEVDEIETNFVSRYLTDYEPIDCLGRGGYGVVFVARNKLDDCHYAIKRIGLSNSQTSRERVIREVKALAKLDHHNIVRYFNSWVECPPNGWQEQHDSSWLQNKKFVSSNYISEFSNADSSVCIDVPNSHSSSVESALEAVELNHDTEDSFIEFKNSTHNSDDSKQDDNDSQNDVEASYNSAELNIERDHTNEAKSRSNDHFIVFEDSKTHSNVDASRRKSLLSLNLRKRKNSSKTNAKMFLYIQMQLCQTRSLKDWLQDSQLRSNTKDVVRIFDQIVDAVHYVHLQGLIHRDLKPSNIFFSFDNKVKIGDFGLVTAMTESCNGVRTPSENEKTLPNKVHTARVGTHLYMSPEQMNGQNYNYKVDIYSLGIILFELLSLFSTDMERISALTNLRNSLYPKDFPSRHPEEYELLKMMLDHIPENRPTTIGIKERPPLKGNSTKIDSPTDEKWHFELPPLSRHSSITNSSGSDSWENMNS